jgi:ankyrin repeat protein
VVQLLAVSGANPNAQEKDGWTALHWASHKAHIKILQTLLAHGADPSIKRNVRF